MKTLELTVYRDCERALKLPELKQALYDEGAILMVLGAGANVTIEPEQWPSGEHPFRSTTVAGTGGWQGTKGGALAPKDDGQ